MDPYGHGLPDDFRIPVSDGDGVLFMERDDHLRVLVTLEVDNRIVQTTEAGSGYKGEVVNVQPGKLFCDYIATVLDFEGFGLLPRPIVDRQYIFGRGHSSKICVLRCCLICNAGGPVDGNARGNG
jgi:hypothetical protein